ncbi:MAG: hypothetical protein ACR2PL_15180 [Dehalococcoidia bacterium]
MKRTQKGFPTRLRLWEGAILATVVQAIRQASSARRRYERRWEGRTYCLDDEQGGQGAVSFGGDGLVGAFFDHESPRSPWAPGGRYPLDRLFAGIPASLFELAQRQIFPRLSTEYEGKQIPLVTAAFWSKDDSLTAAEPWSKVVEHNADLIRIEIMEQSVALVGWEKESGFSSAQSAFVRSLFDRRMASSEQPVVVGAWEREILIGEGDAGLEHSRELLAAVNIILPWA